MGLDINETSIKKEGLNLAIDLDEVIQNGLIQNLNIGEINTKIHMIRVDKEEIKKRFEEKINKQKNIMIKQFEEMEKLEDLNKKENKELNVNFDINDNSKNLKQYKNTKIRENKNIIHENNLDGEPAEVIELK